MSQIASFLAMATVFAWLMVCNVDLHFIVRGGGAYTWDKTTYAETWAKNAGGGRNRGILWYML